MLGAPFPPGSGQGFSPAELSLAAQHWDLAQGTQRLVHTEATLSLSAPLVSLDDPLLSEVNTGMGF